ncbi:ROK family protein [Kitasatospora sp. A2-31]|uniref:ROK family protein n=1 Tax=Kitasatospora sp. A2-31 TaxID=2916414 RepID=UPI001EECEE46|nr:ROK family protein [Kitasatospora sp. A2-31]MCG6497820.1 ROK family protein [Kitasatospora sp. A2-31]
MSHDRAAAPDDQRPERPALLAALDVGGTKIAGGLVGPDGELLHRVQLPTPAREGADAVLATVHRVLDLVAEHPLAATARAVGVGSAGPVDIRRGTVSPVNIPGWRDFPLRDAVAAHPGAEGRPVVLGGDAVAMAAAEHWRGAARPYRNALCIVVSTGVGAGLILDGRLHTGPTGNAGHLGHITVDLDGRPCPCGSRGCIEGLASGTAIARTAREAGWRPAGTEVATGTGGATGPGGPADASAAAVAEAARAGDPIARQAFDGAARALAAGIAATATLVEIEAAVIGGGVAQAGEVFFEPLRRHLADYATLPFASGVTVLPARLGTDAGLVGAAALALDALPT